MNQIIQGDILRQTHVMVVDDDAFIRKTIVHVLRSFGVGHITEAVDGDAALRALGQSRPGLIITDVEMPKMNGLDMLKFIRAGKSAAPVDLRIVVLTSYSNIDVLGACMALDVNGFLVKPIQGDIAHKKIMQALTEPFVSVKPSVAYLAVPTAMGNPQHVPAPPVATDVVNASVLRERSAYEGQPAARAVDVENLQAGMTIAEGIFFRDGSLVLAAGHVLTSSNINRLADLVDVLQTRSARIKW